MGLDLVHVLSPKRHHCEFECVVCNRLTSLDSYVTSACSHPICKSCCTATNTTSNGTKSTTPNQRLPPAECPSCKTRNVVDESTLVKLSTVQPLAYRVLCRVKVACPLRKRHHDCNWTGDYKSLQIHVEWHRRADRQKSSSRKENSKAEMDLTSSNHTTTNTITATMNDDSNKSDGNKKETVPPGQLKTNQKTAASDKVPRRSMDFLPTNSETIMKRRNSAGMNNTTMPTGPLPRSSMDPLPGSAIKMMQRRNSAGMNNNAAGSNNANVGNKSARRNSSSGMLLNENLAIKNSQHTATSIMKRRNSSGGGGASTMASSNGPSTTQCHSESATRKDVLPSKAQQQQQQSASEKLTTATARSLKERASHAFRDGNYRDAVTLYSQAIRKKDDCPHFVSTIYANRAAAHLRLNSFGDCIHDCDEALRLDYTNIKAYLRKSWAQVEVGRFEDACTSLAIGLGRVPKSVELEREIKFTKVLSQTMKDVRKHQNDGNHQQVIATTDALEVHQSNKHVLLARGNAYLSLAETSKAIETATQVFVSDGENTDAFELRAKARFWDARLEDSLMDCQTALCINSQRPSIGDLYKKIRKAYQLYADAERSMRNEAYKEAAKKYSATLTAAEPLPKSTELYRVLHLAKAEAHFHAANHGQALANANLVLESQRTNLAAWKTKIKIFKAMNKLEQLADEMAEIMTGYNSWGTEHPFLVDAYDETLDLLDDEISTPSSVPDYYDILGVDSACSIDEIRKVYRLKARECHPDKAVAGTDVERLEAKEKFQRLQQCMDVLADVDSRRVYDQKLGLSVGGGIT